MNLTQEQIDACRREEGKVFGLCSPEVQQALRDVGWQNREMFRGCGWDPDISAGTPNTLALRLKPNVVAPKPWKLTQEMINLCRKEDDLPFERKSKEVKEILKLVPFKHREYGNVDWKQDQSPSTYSNMHLRIRNDVQPD